MLICDGNDGMPSINSLHFSEKQKSHQRFVRQVTIVLDKFAILHQVHLNMKTHCYFVEQWKNKTIVETICIIELPVIIFTALLVLTLVQHDDPPPLYLNWYSIYVF